MSGTTKMSTFVTPDRRGPTGAGERAPGGATAVAWGHALPLAVLLSFANEFWIIALRGAVGAIERTSDPFSSWWHEAVLLVPVHMVAVLVAFALLRRWWGGPQPAPRRVVPAVGLVALVGALAGTVLLVASSVIDYRLEALGLQHMVRIHGGCDALCLSQRSAATVHLQLESVATGAVLMTIVDFVLVSLLVAFRGGRLVVARRRETARQPLPGAVLVLTAGLAGAALIHAAVVPEHLREWWAAGVFFLALCAAQLVAAALVLLPATRRRPTAAAAAVAVSVGPLALWTVSRTVGLPFGPEAWTPETVGIPDVVSGLLEVMTALLALGLLVRSAHARRLWAPFPTAIAVASVLALTAVGFGASGVPGLDAFAGRSGPAVHGTIGGER